MDSFRGIRHLKKNEWLDRVYMEDTMLQMSEWL